MPKIKNIENKKLKALEKMLWKNIETIRLISLWNKMVDYEFKTFVRHFRIGDMSNIKSEPIEVLAIKMDCDNFNVEDNYYALNNNNKYISFNELKDYDMFDMKILIEFMIQYRSIELYNFKDEMYKLLLKEFTNKDKAKEIIDNLSKYGIVDIFQNNWDNIVYSVNGIIDANGPK